MEMERDTGAMLGMYACDADLFAKVWERVGAEGRPDCPVTAIPAGQLAREPEQQKKAAGTPAPAAETASAPQPAGRMAEMGESGGDDFPLPDDLPCLGRASAGQAAQLQRYIWEELEGWQLYRHLARRVNGPNARALAALASEKHRRARRLAAAHFLIAGVRCWPTDRLDTPRLTSWLGVLRERFGTEQRHEHRYRAAACETTDPCLAELYAELANECVAHAAVLRSVLESAL